MKNPLLAIIALVALAGILFAQAPPSSLSAHSVVRQLELVGPIQVEGVVPLRNHLSIPWAASGAGPFIWTCPAGVHARGTGYTNYVTGGGNYGASLHFGPASGAAPVNVSSAWQSTVFHPGDTLTINAGYSASNAGIVSLELEYD